MPLHSNHTRTYFALAVLVLACAGGCKDRTTRQVVVYTALDNQFSEPIFDDFEGLTQYEVMAKFDTESTKTVGLAEAILAERKRPRCDVFWNNEILNTLRLEREGLLASYQSPAADSFPEFAKSPEGTWHGFAARARVLVVNNDLVQEKERPRSIRDLAGPKWRGKAGIAKPLFGTTATHAACLFARLGSDEAKKLFLAMKENDIQIQSGNKQVAVAVAAGRLAFGLTDTDDAIFELERGAPVTIVYPDQDDGGLGTLFIPNTVAIIKGGPHPDEARKLVDFLLSPEVERRLARGPSAQIPLNPKVKVQTRVKTPAEVRAMEVDWQKAVDHWTAAITFIRDEFATAE